ncbi:MAG: ArnT family glycosyltransferase [Candidatus Xenobiia bacterium LiM19]
MKPRYALIPVIIGAVYLLAAALIVIFSGGATLTSGNLSISIHSLRSPISVFWALLIISAFLLSIKKSDGTPDSVEHQQKTDQRALQRIELIVLILLFTAALAVRVYKITLPPLDFHPTRQYNNAIIARQLYCNTLQGPDDRWKHGFYNVGQLFLEPPVSEMTAVLGYLVLGFESLIVPRLLSSLFWLAGGMALYCAMRRLSGRQGAFFGTLLFLFLPYAIASSRCFMPDPIMVSALCFYILAIVRYADRPTIGNLVFCIVSAACTIFLKGMSVFIIFGGCVCTAAVSVCNRAPVEGKHHYSADISGLDSTSHISLCPLLFREGVQGPSLRPISPQSDVHPVSLYRMAEHGGFCSGYRFSGNGSLRSQTFQWSAQSASVRHDARLSYLFTYLQLSLCDT